jgi:hypothetical protein
MTSRRLGGEPDPSLPYCLLGCRLQVREAEERGVEPKGNCHPKPRNSERRNEGRNMTVGTPTSLVSTATIRNEKLEP